MQKSRKKNSILIISAIIILVAAYFVILNIRRHEKEDIIQPEEQSLRSLNEGYVLLENQLSDDQKLIYHNEVSSAFSTYITKLEDSFGKLQDFKIDTITLIATKSTAQGVAIDWLSSPEFSNNAFLSQVYFSVRPELEEGSSWNAGNGQQGADGWIISKELVIVLDKKNSAYEVVGAGTGPI